MTQATRSRLFSLAPKSSTPQAENRCNPGALEDAFSQLERIYIPICVITKHDPPHTDVERELQ
jgi:hypothetical protein